MEAKMSKLGFGKKLKTARVSNNISIAELSKKTEISQSMLRYYEREEKNPSINNVIAIAKALIVPISYFVEDDLEDEDKLNMIKLITDKLGIGIGSYSLKNLTTEEIDNLENDLELMLKIIKEKYKIST